MNALSREEFDHLRKVLYSQTGIALGDEKAELVGGRLRNRLTAHGLSDYAGYLRILRNDPDEMSKFINALTTNKTDFFREASHFAHLERELLPKAARGRPFMVWSAACSTGQEPYTLGIVMEDFARGHPGFDFRVLGSDIDTNVLEQAERAVYDEQTLAPVPPEALRAHFETGKGNNEGLYRVKEHLRAKYKFRRFNLVEGGDLPAKPLFDCVFLRNVLIYFDPASTKRVIENVLVRLKPDGHLFIGHSESLRDHGKELVFVGDAIYRKR